MNSIGGLIIMSNSEAQGGTGKHEPISKYDKICTELIKGKPSEDTKKIEEIINDIKGKDPQELMTEENIILFTKRIYSGWLSLNEANKKTEQKEKWLGTAETERKELAKKVKAYEGAAQPWRKAANAVTYGLGISLFTILGYAGIQKCAITLNQELRTAQESFQKESESNGKLKTILDGFEKDPALAEKRKSLEDLTRKCNDVNEHYALIQKSIEDKNKAYINIESQIKQITSDIEKLTNDYAVVTATINSQTVTIEERGGQVEIEKTNFEELKKKNETGEKEGKDMYTRQLAEQESKLQKELGELKKKRESFEKIRDEQGRKQ
jgi:poly(A) polymerase Pap1